MNVLNDLFTKVFLITINPPNDRIDYITDHLREVDLNYDLRVAFDRRFTSNINHEWGIVYPEEQSLSSTYASILCESFYKRYGSIVIIEDDTQFIPTFEESFAQFYTNTPSDWDVLHLGDYDNADNIKIVNVNEYVDRVFVKFTTNCIILKNEKSHYLDMYDKIVGSKYPVDHVFNHFYENELLKCYCPTKKLTDQLSYRPDESPSGKVFKSLLR
jgi:hypothetical protein